MAMATSLLILLFIVPAVYAVDHTVGGTSGWNTGVDYNTWAAGETFTVGDNLVFTYDSSSHGVYVVDKAAYSNCATGNPLKSYSDGSTTIALTSAGSMYFICPSFGHCGQGMKLAVNVVSSASTTPAGTPPTTPTPSTPTATPTTPATTPTTTTSTTSPPPPSRATGNFHNMNILVLGVSIILAPVLVLMG